MVLKGEELKSYLDQKFEQYNSRNFVHNDPILIPHKFTKKEDIEIAGFLAATIAWGNRKSIINSANKIMAIMSDEPYDFIMNYVPGSVPTSFVHRTFNAFDLDVFFQCLSRLYQSERGLEGLFSGALGQSKNLGSAISIAKKNFLGSFVHSRTKKHFPDPGNGSAAKRICMYLRWMTRVDSHGVDFGIWKSIPTKDLMLPLDVHTGNVGRTLGLLKRKQNDWKAVEELTAKLRTFDPKDPVKYDFALFGIGEAGELK